MIRASQLCGSRTQQEAAETACAGISSLQYTVDGRQKKLLSGLTQMHGRLLTAGHGSTCIKLDLSSSIPASRGSRRRSAKVWRALIRRCCEIAGPTAGLFATYLYLDVHRGRTAVCWIKKERKFCGSVSLHRRIASVCGFHRANRQSCGSSEALPLCEAMWTLFFARLRWRDQGHLVGCASCLLACFLCPPSVRGGHVRFINSSILMVCCREQAIPGTGEPLVRACMMLFQVTKWLDERVPLSRRDAAPPS